jgi:hypothetical protein
VERRAGSGGASTGGSAGAGPTLMCSTDTFNGDHSHLSPSPRRTSTRPGRRALPSRGRRDRPHAHSDAHRVRLRLPQRGRSDHAGVEHGGRPLPPLHHHLRL